jgi:hypothetical protein
MAGEDGACIKIVIRSPVGKVKGSFARPIMFPSFVPSRAVLKDPRGTSTKAQGMDILDRVNTKTPTLMGGVVSPVISRFWSVVFNGAVVDVQ